MYRLLLTQEANKDLASSGGAGDADGGGGRVSSASLKMAKEEAQALKSQVHELERVRLCGVAS